MLVLEDPHSLYHHLDVHRHAYDLLLLVLVEVDLLFHLEGQRVLMLGFSVDSPYQNKMLTL